MNKILALDLGTSYLKAALFDRDGEPCALTRIQMPVEDGPCGRREMNPQRFFETVKKALAHLSQSESGSLEDVAAVSMASQSNSFLLLDRWNNPVTPVILWTDERARDMTDATHALSRIPGFRRVTGVPAIGPEFMAPKLMWLRKNLPATWGTAARLSLLDDYLTWWFTGHHATEAGTAGLTGVVDIHHLAWWHPVCEALSVSHAWLPDIVRAGTDLGRLHPKVAADLRLPRSCRFVIGCLDQYAGAIGLGCTGPGVGTEATGTALATVRYTRGFRDPASDSVFQGPGLESDTYFEMVFSLISANLLERYGRALPDRLDFDAMIRAAEAVPPGADGLRLRSDAPWVDWSEAFVGWSERHSHAHAIRCILEGTARELARLVAALWGAEPPAVIRSCGGAARSDLWMQIKADMLDMTFEVTKCAEASCLGAAMLAAQALGWGRLPDLVKTWVRISRAFEPRPEMHKRYCELFAGGTEPDRVTRGRTDVSPWSSVPSLHNGQRGLQCRMEMDKRANPDTGGRAGAHLEDTPADARRA